VELETSNLVGRLIVASSSARSVRWQILPGRGVVWSGHTNHLHFGGHQPYL